jgi:hypothetical protein
MSDAQAPDRPFVAGRYDYYLAGAANSHADHAAVEQIRAVLPEVRDAAWANPAALQRAANAVGRQP